jgi:diguanylate cyclase (GGDEF)-like protein
LGEVARRLGRGDYSAPIPITSSGAIRDLENALVVMRDGIAEREDEIKRLAFWDALTNFPNRVQFISLLKEAIATTLKGQSCYVLMMDLDGFKHVNDILGHSYGDTMLKEFAQRLRERLPNTQIARLGGDEFALLLPNSSLAQATDIANIVLEALGQPIMLNDQTVDVGGGIGLAGYPEHGKDAEELLSHAEIAMYAAKRGAGNQSVTYSAEIDQGNQDMLSLVSELRNALEHDEFRLYVQPKLDLKSNDVIGAEALVRWEHPTRGFMSPDQFIPFAEQTGEIRLITRWVVEKSAALMAQLLMRGITLKISVNMSTHDLLDLDLPMKLTDIFVKHRIKPQTFCLEITESAMMSDPHRAQLTLRRLDSLGVDLAIDDFGTGYSSLAYLKQLPVKELKIDKSFVLPMTTSTDDRKIVKSTIDLGHNLGLRVVAEGVETEEAMTLLAQMGCDQVQGYYIHKPMPAEQFIEWVEQRKVQHHSTVI